MNYARMRISVTGRRHGSPKEHAAVSRRDDSCAPELPSASAAKLG